MRRVLVVGGSRGIGRAIAESFHDDLDEVLCISRNGGAPAGCWQARLDVGIVQAADLNNIGPYDVVVNTAGVKEDRPQHVMAVNATAPMLLTHAVLGIMRAGGTILHFSGAGVGGPTHGEAPDYTAAKAAVVQYVECMAPLLAKRDITINAVAPGKVATAMTGGQGSGPERAVALVKFLCGPEARHITGRLLAARDDIERLKQPMGPDDYKLRRVVP